MSHDSSEREQLQQERWSLLEQINSFGDKPLIALSFVWLGLLIVDLTPLLQTVSTIIWSLFALDFAIEIVIAPPSWRI